jgi:hypothetical protein
MQHRLPRFRIVSGAVLVLALAIRCPAEDAVQIEIAPPHGAIQQWTSDELRTYWDKMFRTPAEFSAASGHATLIVGTPQTSPRIKEAIDRKLLTLPEGKNADQGYAMKTIDGRIYVAASTDVGVLYGVYALLEAYGAYFLISGDILPDKMAFQVRPLDRCVTPVFKYRGLMPWDNFLCGSSGYNLEDWQTLIRNATRMKLNFLNLHFYPGYVMYTDSWGGREEPPQWVAQPDDFVPAGKPGARAFGNMTKLFVRPWEENKGHPEKQAAACQQMLREAIDFAHGRGWTVSAGFALMEPVGGGFTMVQRSNGDNTPVPFDPHNIELSVERYRRLTQIYPNADYYWMWQSEGGGPRFREIDARPGYKEFRQRYAAWSDPKLAGDIDYAYLFLQVAKRLTPAERSRLATGGWAIQHLFPNIQPDCPRELIFASLNDAYPQGWQASMDSYRVAQQGRRCWMISWWEFDGNEWFPQFRTSWHEKKYRRAAELGVEGVAQLGWKWSAVEHGPRYLADFAWEPTLTAKEFYRRYVTRVYGPKAVASLAPLYDAYDAWETHTPAASPADYRPMLLGAGWCPLGLPGVPFAGEGLNGHDWRETVVRANDLVKTQRELMEVDLHSVQVLDETISRLDEQGRGWATLLRNRLEFRAIYLRSVTAMNRAFLVYDETARKQGVKAGAGAAEKEAAAAVTLAAQAIDKYADDCRNRGDLGVIGQLNVQFLDVLKQLDDAFRQAAR